MPNPVAVNDLSPISGSLQTSRISYGVETAGKNYGQNYNSATWYSDIPNNGEFYTIISDNYTANYYVSRSNAEGAYVEGGLPAVDEYSAPVFWVTAGTSSLDVITIVNGLPDRRGQIPFNSGSQALNWVASSSNYFAVGPDYYAQIDADNLQLYLDANQIISYPTTMSTWYDLSGYSSKGTLVNSPAFNSNGWFDFDGTDDYVNFFNNSLLNIGTSNFSQTVTFLINSIPGTGQRITFKRFGGLGYGYSMFIDGSGALGFEILTPSNSFTAYGGYPSTGRWHQATFSLDRSGNGILYLDGVAGTPVSFSSLVGLDISNNEDFCLAAVSPAIGGGAYLNGDLATVASYAKQLSAAEVLQNYYGGPIVTDNLVFAIDAGNLVSYPKSGTTAYSLTGSVNGTLTNGPTFNPTFGGCWNFDGTDDYIQLGSSITPENGNWTLSAWVKGFGGVVGNTSGGPIASTFGVLSSGGYKIYYANYDGAWQTHYGNTTLDPNTWYFLTWVNYAGASAALGTMKMYINASPDSSVFNSYTTNGGPVDAVGYSAFSTGYFNGNIASVYWNIGKAFTDDEVLQNYNATK
jgi:hypothetical protein